MGTFIIGLYCMVFYSVLIILSVFQTDWVRGHMGGARDRGGGRGTELIGGGRAHGRGTERKHLSAISSSVERECISQLYINLVSRLVQWAITFTAEYHNYYGWGI